MTQQVFFHLFGILSSISSSLHFHDCSSWTSSICREIRSELLSQSVVSVFFWSNLLQTAVLLLICFSGLDPISLVLTLWCHANHLLHLQMQTKMFSRQSRVERSLSLGWSSSMCHLHEAAFVSKHVTHIHHWAHLHREPTWLRYHWRVALTFYNCGRDSQCVFFSLQEPGQITNTPLSHLYSLEPRYNQTQ